MTTHSLLLALAAGIISAVVFASATTGFMLLRLVLFFLTPLSLYLAGLGLGPMPAAIAAITATGAVMAMSNPVTAMVYALSTGIPAVMISRLALLSRTEGDVQHWYPVGRIVMAAAAFGGFFAALVMILMGADVETLTKAMRTVVEAFVKTELPNIPGAPTVNDAQIGEITDTALRSLPWILGCLSMATALINLWLAARITLASGRLTRPWPDLAGMELPGMATFALIGATAATFAGGFGGLLAGGFAGPFTLAFALLGLCVAHVLTRGSPWCNFILTSLYAALVVISAGASLVLAIIGLAETIFHYRRASARQPPASPS